LVGDVLIRSAFVSYAGAFSLNDRDMLFHSWMSGLKLQNIPCTENSDIVDALVDANTVSSAIYFYFLRWAAFWAANFISLNVVQTECETASEVKQNTIKPPCIKQYE